jgi:hypothetical protein
MLFVHHLRGERGPDAKQLACFVNSPPLGGFFLGRTCPWMRPFFIQSNSHKELASDATIQPSKDLVSALEQRDPDRLCADRTRTHDWCIRHANYPP